MDNKITPEMLEAGTKFVMNFFPAEWGGSRGISEIQAESVAQGVLKAALSEAAFVKYIIGLERALRPFAKFEKAGWAESHWEGKPDEYVVMVRYKNQKMTKTTITLGDFRIALKTYEECK